jgi:ATP-binding cassette, subfamily B, bacterial PglK
MVYLEKIKYILSIFPKSKYIKLYGIFFLSSILDLLSIGIVIPYVALLQDIENYKSNENLIFLSDLLPIDNYTDMAFWLSLILVLVFLLKNILSFLSQYHINFFTENLIMKVRLRLFSAYISAPYEFYVERNSSDLINNIVEESRVFGNNVFRNLLSIFFELTFLISLVIIITIYQPIGILVSIVLLMFLVLFYKFSKKITFAIGEIGTVNNVISHSIVNQSINGIKVLKIHNKSSFYYKKLKESLSKIRDSGSKFWIFLLLPRMFIEIITISFIAFGTYVLINTGGNPSNLLPVFAAIAIISIRLIPSVNKVSNSLSSINNSKASTFKLFKDLVEIEGFESQNLIGKKVQFDKEIKLSSVSFKYKKSNSYSLSKFNLVITKGSIVGIVGQSGSGKSTLCDLILGILDPTSGSIFIDNKNLKDNKSGWWDIIGYVPQKIYLMDESIAANVVLDSENYDKERLYQALKGANLYKFIDELPLKESTIVGEDGVRLSGGQKQRIGIARALYKNPSVLILDEATSSLDSGTEKNITDYIHSMSKDLTIISIAHNINSLRYCSRIIHVEEGRLKSISTHQEINGDS